MKRIVPLVITDPEVDNVLVTEIYPVAPGEWDVKRKYDVPVPPDDQLTQDLKLACRALDMYADFAWSGGQAIEGDKATVRLRTAFGLDQEEE